MTSPSALTSIWRMGSLSEFTSVSLSRCFDCIHKMNTEMVCIRCSDQVFNVFLFAGKSGRTSSFLAGWKPSTPTVACWCPAASTYTRASRCPTGEWRPLTTSTRGPRRRWPAEPRWLVSPTQRSDLRLLEIRLWGQFCVRTHREN